MFPFLAWTWFKLANSGFNWVVPSTTPFLLDSFGVFVHVFCLFKMMNFWRLWMGGECAGSPLALDIAWISAPPSSSGKWRCFFGDSRIQHVTILLVTTGWVVDPRFERYAFLSPLWSLKLRKRGLFGTIGYPFFGTYSTNEKMNARFELPAKDLTKEMPALLHGNNMHFFQETAKMGSKTRCYILTILFCWIVVWQFKWTCLKGDFTHYLHWKDEWGSKVDLCQDAGVTHIFGGHGGVTNFWTMICAMDLTWEWEVVAARQTDYMTVQANELNESSWCKLWLVYVAS